MGKIIDKWLTKEDKKEGLLKSVKNIGDKSEELKLKAFSAANKVCKTANNETDYNYDTRFAFYRF